VAQRRGALQGEIGLPETYRRAVEAALPRGVTVDSDFWDALWGILGRYLLAEQYRKCNPPTARTKEWQRFEKRLVQFKGAMIAVRRTIDRRMIDPENQPPAWWINLLWAVQEAQWRASEYSQSYQKAGAGFRGRTNPQRERLYGDILRLWQGHLGQSLAISRSPKKGGAPYGPPIQFFKACVSPVLGETAPMEEGIVSAIKREQQRQASPKCL
jgi:hypothetical protein